MRSLRRAAMAVGAIVVVASLAAPSASVATGPAPAGGDPVEVDPGPQLSTVLASQSETVAARVEETRFGARYASGTDDRSRAGAIDRRLAVLVDRVDRLTRRYDGLRESYRNERLSASVYVARLASLHARAASTNRSLGRLERRAATVPVAVRQDVGIELSRIRSTRGRLGPLTGSDLRALLERVRGEVPGDITVSAASAAVSVSGAYAKTTAVAFSRAPDGDDSITVDAATARETARAELSRFPVPTQEWRRVDAVRNDVDGVFVFLYSYEGPGHGETTVVVDGSSGEVVTLEGSIAIAEDAGDGRLVPLSRG